jgi:hypothetical protein
MQLCRPKATQSCFYGPIRPRLDGGKGWRRLSLWGEFGSLFLYLEMLEQIEQTQGATEYCKVVD